MCGIAGIVALADGLPSTEIDELARMAGALRHRGPDEFGIYRDRRAGFAHARLSIIDLSSGQQPLSNETGSLWVVFNGEIFNYIELRQVLEAAGHVFRTRSDTEVIVHAYEEWGDAAFSRFNGQWAIALWNASTSTLVLARDPFGVRPLYVAEHQGRLIFASEVKAMFAGEPSLPRRLDSAGLDQIFTFWTTVAPRTVFEGIEEVEPGTVRTYTKDGVVRQSRSAAPAFPVDGANEFRGSLEDAVEEVRSALDAATHLRMLRADVPVGSYLSGGLDSSLIAALGLRAKGSRFSTFSLRFADAEYDETPYQRAMSEYIGSDHHEVLVSRGDIARVFPDVIRHTERPVLRTAPAPLFLLSRLVRDAGIKVVLTGEGADEMFAGYDLFREAKVRRFWARVPESGRRPRLLERLYPYLERSPVTQRAFMRQFFGQGLDRATSPGFGHDVRWRGTMALKRLLAAERRIDGETDATRDLIATLPSDFRRWTPLAQDQFLEVHTLLSGYLLSSQGDRMLMAHSVEGRFPFLDRNVAALAESLPPSYKLRVLDEKHVLKKAADGLVPASILERKKQPYRAPDALSFAAPEAREWIEEVASHAALADAGIFSPAAARHLIDKCRSQAASGQFSNADNMGVVGVLSTQLLHYHFIRQRPEASVPPLVRTIVDRMGATLGAA
ncbi:MAG TPA: asparagine synthase (glutamine-hydrolyzing) [Vicinamibacterales bacterium]|nr:asparagine synthase (glutamine-hydrolyzing) [Vicinamibacterales bacterium]